MSFEVIDTKEGGKGAKNKLFVLATDAPSVVYQPQRIPHHLEIKADQYYGTFYSDGSQLVQIPK